MATTKTTSELREEISRLRMERRRAYAQHMIEMEEQERYLHCLNQQRQKASARVGLHNYVDAMKQVNGENELSIYAVKQQATLCSTLHRIEVQVKQFQLAKDHYEEMSTFMYAIANEVTLEKLNREKNIINQMALIAIETSSLKDHCDAYVKAQHAELLRMRAAIPSANDWEIIEPNMQVRTDSESSRAVALSMFFKQFDQMSDKIGAKKGAKQSMDISSANVVAALHKNLHKRKTTAAKARIERASFVAKVA